MSCGGFGKAMGPGGWMRKLCPKLSGKLWQHILAPTAGWGEKEKKGKK